MTTDNFTEAARAEAEERYEFVSDMSCFEEGAEWARTHLAAQEPADAEVRAAAFAVMELDGDRGLDGFTYGHIARAALSAARRDEEKRAACGCDLTGPVPPAVHIVDRHEERQ